MENGNHLSFSLSEVLLGKVKEEVVFQPMLLPLVKARDKGDKAVAQYSIES